MELRLSLFNAGMSGFQHTKNRLSRIVFISALGLPIFSRETQKFFLHKIHFSPYETGTPGRYLFTTFNSLRGVLKFCGGLTDRGVICSWDDIRAMARLPIEQLITWRSREVKAWMEVEEVDGHEKDRWMDGVVGKDRRQ